MLQQELERTIDQIADLEKSLEEKPDYGLGEGDPAIVRWEMNHTLLQQYRERATNLKEALSRANQGTYGMCVQCGKAIHPDRLAVLPGTKLCIDCARARSSN